MKRRFGGRGALVYSQGTGRAAALVPTGDGWTLEVAAVLGMRWRPGTRWATRWRRREFVSGEGAGSARASAPSTTRRRAASRCTATRSGSTALAAARAATCWTSSSGPRACRCQKPSRGWTAAQGLRPGPHSSSRNAASPVRRAASPRPRPADGGGALLRRTAPALPRSAGVPGLTGHRPGPGVPGLLREAHPGLRAVHGAGGGAVRRHGRRPRRHRRPRPLARGAGRRSPPDAPLPGPPRPQAGAWDGASRPRAVLGSGRRGPVRLARPYRLGPPRRRCPGHPGHGAGRLSPAGLSPRLPRLRQR